MNDELKYLYDTHDAEEAELLFAAEMKIDSIDWRDGVCTFYYRDSKKCREILHEHISGDLRLNSMRYVDGRRTIRNILRKK